MAKQPAKAHKEGEASGGGPARRASDRGRYGRLSRERVLATALDLVDREGLTALSMRRLGAELGVEAMALYRYAPSKDALLDGLVEAVYSELEDRLTAETETAAVETNTPTPRSELHRVARATYDVFRAHAAAVPLFTTRMLAVPLAQRPLPILRHHERVISLLQDSGLDTVRSAAALRTFTGWMLGYVSVELQAMVDNPEESDPGFRLGLHRMPPQELPLLRAATPALAEQGGPQGLSAGLDALLDIYTRR